MRWCMISFLEISDNHFDMKSELNWTVCYVMWFLISSDHLRRDETVRPSTRMRTEREKWKRGVGGYEQKSKARGGHTVDDDGEKEQI